MLFLTLSYLSFCAILFFLLRMCFRKGERFEMFKRVPVYGFETANWG